MTEFSLLMPLQCKAPGNSWLVGVQNYMENKNEVNENKIKQKHFMDAVPVMPCQNLLLIMCFWIHGERRIQIPLSSPATIGPLEKI